MYICAYQPIAVTPQQIVSLRQHQQHSGSGPPPLLLAPRASVPQVQGQRIIQQGLIRVANVSNSNVMVNIPQVRTKSRRISFLENFYAWLCFLNVSLKCCVSCVFFFRLLHQA